MSTKNNEGPWGQHNEAIDALAEDDQKKADSLASDIAFFSNELRKQIKSGDETAGRLALDQLFLFDTQKRFQDSPSALGGFAMAIFEEVGTKYGWTEVNKLLDDARVKPASETFRKQLKQRVVGWRI